MQHIIRMEINEENMVDENNLAFPAPAALGEILESVNDKGKESDKIQLIIGDLIFEFTLKPHQYQLHTVGSMGKLSIIFPPVSAEAVMHIRKFIPEKIELQDLIKGENSDIVVTAIKEIVSAGKSIAVIGENGTGKSTFVKCLTQIIPVGKQVVLYNELVTMQDCLAMVEHATKQEQILIAHQSKCGADFHRIINAYLTTYANGMEDKQSSGSLYLPNVYISYVIELIKLGNGQRVIRKMSRWEWNGTEPVEKEIFNYDMEKNEYSF